MKKSKLTILPNGIGFKKDKLFEKCFAYRKCQYCDEWISNCGWASKSHYDMHVRKGHIK